MGNTRREDAVRFCEDHIVNKFKCLPDVDDQFELHAGCVYHKEQEWIDQKVASIYQDPEESKV